MAMIRVEPVEVRVRTELAHWPPPGGPMGRPDSSRHRDRGRAPRNEGLPGRDRSAHLLRGGDARGAPLPCVPAPFAALDRGGARRRGAAGRLSPRNAIGPGAGATGTAPAPGPATAGVEHHWPFPAAICVRRPPSGGPSGRRVGPRPSPYNRPSHSGRRRATAACRCLLAGRPWTIRPRGSATSPSTRSSTCSRRPSRRPAAGLHRRSRRRSEPASSRWWPRSPRTARSTRRSRPATQPRWLPAASSRTGSSPSPTRTPPRTVPSGSP